MATHFSAVGQIRQFAGEAAADIRELRRFLKKEKALKLICLSLILVCWGLKIVYDDIFIDSEIMSLEPYALLQSWYGSRRFSLIFTKKIFHMIRLVPYLSNLLTAAFLFLAALLFAFCLQTWIPVLKKKLYDKGLLLAAAFFVTAPSLAEQYAYTLQAFEITLSMCICMIAVYCAGRAVYGNGSVIWYLAAVLLLVWTLGSYQGFCVCYMALVLISFLGSYETDTHKGPEKAFLYGIRQVIIFIIGFILYFLTASFLCRIKGGDSSYVDAMFMWGTLSTAECLHYVKDEFRALYCGVVPVLYNRFFGIMAFGCTIFLAVRSVKLHFKKWYWYFLGLFLLLVSPMFVTLLSGMRTPVRGQLVFPLLLGAFACIFYCFAVGCLKRVKGFSVRTRCVVVSILFVAMFYQSWVQGMDLVQLNQTLHDTVVNDRIIAQQMYGDIRRVADRSDMQNCPVVFVGTRSARIPNTAARGEVIGYSYFDFGLTNIGINNRTTGLFNLMGLNLATPTVEEYEQALQEAADKPCWPAKESVFLLDDGCVAVKLSE